MSTRIKLIVVLITAQCLSACISLKQPQQEITYYSVSSAKIKPVDTPLPFTLKVDRFSVAPQYNSRQIIYSNKPNTSSSYSYHKWHLNPGLMISDVLFRNIKQSGSYKAVFPYSINLPVHFILKGHIDDFYELDYKDRWEAHLTLTITLINENEPDPAKSIRLQKTYTETVPCAQKNPQSLAEAMSRAAAEISSDIIKDISVNLK